MSLTPDIAAGRPKTRKGKFGNLRLDTTQFQSLSTSPSPNSSIHLGLTQSNNSFREKIGSIVSGNNTATDDYDNQGIEDETSLAETYLAGSHKKQEINLYDIPAIREPPIPPTLDTQPITSIPIISQSQHSHYHHHNHSNHSTHSNHSNHSSHSNHDIYHSNSSSTSSSSASHNPYHFTEITAQDLETLCRLGEGAAGTVRKVKHKQSNLIMAKKSISTQPDPNFQRQILRELAFLKTCDSPYIVSFYGVFLDDGDTTVSLCMEYCEAGSLEDIYKKARDLGGIIGEPVLERIAESVCKGLVYLHSKRVIHRDIKPSNIVVTRKGEIKLCDFGVSGELINSLAKTFTGTQYYMAPERIQGSAYAVQSDIWSLGLTLIEVSQNRPALPPPDQPNLSIFELLDFIVRQPVPEITGAHITNECKNFVAVCLTKDPKYRPTPARILEHPFILRWQNVPIDIAGWLKEVWGWH